MVERHSLQTVTKQTYNAAYGSLDNYHQLVGDLVRYDSLGTTVRFKDMKSLKNLVDIVNQNIDHLRDTKKDVLGLLNSMKTYQLIKINDLIYFKDSFMNAYKEKLMEKRENGGLEYEGRSDQELNGLSEHKVNNEKLSAAEILEHLEIMRFSDKEYAKMDKKDLVSFTFKNIAVAQYEDLQIAAKVADALSNEFSKQLKELEDSKNNDAASEVLKNTLRSRVTFYNNVINITSSRFRFDAHVRAIKGFESKISEILTLNELDDKLKSVDISQVYDIPEIELNKFDNIKFATKFPEDMKEVLNKIKSEILKESTKLARQIYKIIEQHIKKDMTTEGVDVLNKRLSEAVSPLILKVIKEETKNKSFSKDTISQIIEFFTEDDYFTFEVITEVMRKIKEKLGLNTFSKVKNN